MKTRETLTMRSDDISKYDRKGETNMANNELILAVDDEAHILELLSFNLEASGYRVVTAATGEDALVVCAHERRRWFSWTSCCLVSTVWKCAED